MPNPNTGLTQIKSTDITDGAITNEKVSPSIPATKFNIDLGAAEAQNPFNIGVLGFKHSVNEGLTIFNLVDGVVDEFNSEGGVDTGENSNALYDSSSDSYSNQQVGDIELLLTVNNGYLSDPSLAPVVTYNAQVVGATEAQAMVDTTAYGSTTKDTNYYKALQLTSFANITWPSLTTSVTATLVGGGGGSGYPSPNEGGAGGAVKATINDPEMAGTTWDIMIAGGGYQSHTPASQFPTGGIGGGGMGVHASGGGASAIFNGEATINQGVMYGIEDDASPFSNPYGTSPQGIGFGGTATPGSAPLTVLAIGGGACDINSPSEGGISGDFSQGRDGSGGTSNSRVNYPQSPGYHGGGGRGPTSPYDPSPTSPAVGQRGSARTGSTTQAGDGVSWPQQYFRGAGAYNPPSPGQYDMGGGGSGYRGGGDGYNSGAGHSGQSGGGAGYHDTSLVPAPSITNAPNPYPLTPNGEAEWHSTIRPGLPSSGQTLFTEYATNAGDGSHPAKPGDYPRNGADGAVFLEYQGSVTSTSMTLISDTFTASSAPSTARIVIFAEIPDDLNTDINASVTRDNTTFNSVTLTDEGYQAGSSGIKIFSGTTPLTGSASPQVQLRWKIVGSNLTGVNKIHGVALQWA
tara:strand:+ start:37 stop:1926 length:1890 start_codon:yes stop_codon:yes gene_type:complete